ncbi:AraC family transcriptional regulator [Agathobaculum sp.]|uniref:AraC family transcriptional regulator n=1 Tax=Agathobaculum sp. TaxID=2048138 RepID=UPI002A82DD21|nr:AraC family transcriptional regulator [Agathobaculum sp.]MDY3618624.1 AraC family transcriptional regulator [Agathobaculum sp.]
MDIHEPGVLSRSVRYFFTPSSLAERLFFYPTRVGHYYCGRQYRFGWQCEVAREAGHHLNFMLFLVRRGALELNVEGVSCRAEPGGLALFDCKKQHEYRAAGDDLEFYWLLFNGVQAEAFYRQILSLHGGSHVFPSADPAQTRLLFDRLITYGEFQQRVPEHACSEIIYTLLCELLASSADTACDTPVGRSIAFMDRHFESELSVEEVAAHVGLSSSHFTKLFRARTGYSPYEYITLRRIDRAKSLLLSTGRTVRQIAFDTGYNSEENFIRAFKKKVGVSPTGFRRYPV